MLTPKQTMNARLILSSQSATRLEFVRSMLSVNKIAEGDTFTF